MDFNIFGSAPEYYSGLLGQEATNKLQKRATGTGIANALLALVAQPRNQGYGSALPYIGKALMAGQQAGQNVIESGFGDFERNQKIADMKRKQEQQQRLQGMIAGITDPNERLLAEISPEQYVANKVKPTGKLLTLEEQVAEGLPPTGRWQQKADGTFEQVSGTAPKEPQSMPSSVQEYEFAKSQGYTGSFNQFLENKQPKGVSIQNYGSPVAGVDQQGNPVFFQPDKFGGAPSIVQGVAPPAKNTSVTEGERKAATLLKRMEGSLAQLKSVTQESPSSQKPEVVQSMVRGLPLGIGESAANVITSGKRQQVEAAQLDILDAALTLGTGAAYTKEQLEGYRKSYFPQIGDSKENILAKQQRLNNVIEAAKIASGNALPKQIIPKNTPMSTRNKKDIFNQYGVQ